MIKELDIHAVVCSDLNVTIEDFIEDEEELVKELEEYKEYLDRK